MGKRYNRPDAPAVLHYLTLNVRNQRRAFGRAEYARMVLEVLREECDRYPAKLVAYVAMPTHLHAIINPRDGEVMRFLMRFKPEVTKRLDELAAALGQEGVCEWLKVGSRRELWQDGKHSLHLWSQWMIWQKIHYIHNNPVRAGLVTRPADYPWSSFFGFYPEMGGTPPVAIDTDWWWEE